VARRRVGLRRLAVILVAAVIGALLSVATSTAALAVQSRGLGDRVSALRAAQHRPGPEHNYDLSPAATTSPANAAFAAAGADSTPAGSSESVDIALRGFSAAEDAGGLSRLVIGRTEDLQAPGALQPGEYTLLDRLQEPLDSAQAYWNRNSSVLRQELRSGITQIRDASPGDSGGQFLNAERNVLRNRGWTFDAATSTWNAP
jgi:hypothetical protein